MWLTSADASRIRIVRNAVSAPHPPRHDNARAATASEVRSPLGLRTGLETLRLLPPTGRQERCLREATPLRPLENRSAGLQVNGGPAARRNRELHHPPIHGEW